MLQNNKIVNNINTNLLIVILIAALLRVCFLSTIPNGFHQDEATIGYDAYSFLKTGRNQYGEFLPLFSKAFGDYNESMSRFITVPFIWIFGLTEFATRLPVALIGTITVLILYYLVKELFRERIALYSALFFAISPWHIQFSRIAYTAILVPFFFCLALLFFLRSLRQPKYLSLSAIPFGLSIYTYNPARVFIPTFMLCLVIMFWHHLWRNRKQTLIACTIFLPIFILLFSFWISPEGMTRVRTVGGLITDPIQIMYNYISYFSPNFLFFRGDPFPRHSPLGIGELHLIELITVPVGVFFLSKEESQKRNVLLIWLLLYPIPAALTAPEHALRSIIGSPLFSIISGYGIFKIGDIFKLRKRIFTFFIIFVVTASIAWFGNCYFVDYPKYSKYNTWRYGMKEAISYAENSSDDCVIVSNQFHHMNSFILFYTRYDPLLYQQSPIDPSLSFQGEIGYSLDKYRISPISQELVLNNRCLLIVQPNEVKDFEKNGYLFVDKKNINNPLGTPEIFILKIQKNSKYYVK
ncbi:MAG TPA: glycosyl transferase [Cyanobacteria bacterium UBA11166]|nr:glycosyl transferase [Cyanobacteria bacterium UBA11166]